MSTVVASLSAGMVLIAAAHMRTPGVGVEGLPMTKDIREVRHEDQPGGLLCANERQLYSRVELNS